MSALLIPLALLFLVLSHTAAVATAVVAVLGVLVFLLVLLLRYVACRDGIVARKGQK